MFRESCRSSLKHLGEPALKIDDRKTEESRTKGECDKGRRGESWMGYTRDNRHWMSAVMSEERMSAVIEWHRQQERKETHRGNRRRA